MRDRRWNVSVTALRPTLSGLKSLWREIKCSKDGKIGWSQSGDGFRCQTEKFVFDFRGNREPLELLEQGRNIVRHALGISVWQLCGRWIRVVHLKAGRLIRKYWNNTSNRWPELELWEEKRGFMWETWRNNLQDLGMVRYIGGGERGKDWSCKPEWLEVWWSPQ